MTSIVANGWNTCAIANGGQWCWGDNYDGQLDNQLCDFGMNIGPHAWYLSAHITGGEVSGNIVYGAKMGLNVDGAGTAAAPVYWQHGDRLARIGRLLVRDAHHRQLQHRLGFGDRGRHRRMHDEHVPRLSLTDVRSYGQVTLSVNEPALAP